MTPFFSIIILYWQSDQYLPACLQALQSQTFRDFEVILLDNGSDVPLDENLLSKHANLMLQVTHSDINLGFAGGNNFAARSAKGDYLVLLNGDAFPQPDWLTQVYEAIQTNPAHFFASRLIQANQTDLLDGEWNVLHASGLAWRKNHNQPVEKSLSKPREVLSACAAAGIYPREAFEAVGGFDEDFFAYMEDIDLDMRLQLAGYRCLYLPDAVVLHVGSGSTGSRSDFAVYYGHRNLIWAFVKNMPGILFYLLLPAHIFYNLLYLLAAAFMPAGKSLIKGKKDALKGIRTILQKRKLVQSSRKISVWRFARLLDWNPFSPLSKLAHSEKVQVHDD